MKVDAKTGVIIFNDSLKLSPVVTRKEIMAMTTIAEELKSNIHDLIALLKMSGKNETAVFFQKLYDLIQNGPRQEANKELKFLSHSAALSQYGNFSYQEEKLFFEIIELAIRCRI